MLLLAAAGCNYFMGVPCADDVMLNYQSTSYHDAATVRQILGLRPAPEFLAWLESRGLFEAGRLVAPEPRARDALLSHIRAETSTSI
jgi:ethanolamine ammonia-lyase large subunit